MTSLPRLAAAARSVRCTDWPARRSRLGRYWAGAALRERERFA
ncbi:hypothetical protein [Rhodococcus sp. JS3073]|nr:hypothetical protein [Rhodococcus sp. JS3073]WAM19526.1 hypothetical protein OYT95_38270 [Rhodococcus sp. JS3073]